ncbi:DUF3575 domain-containing protein [Bacteroides sp.]|uniref:DUF3575 domain-containing protein n=1 Tax=Bacteroides sp. TaxID=29523 RepID=UPI002617C49A|nr:DUF3575 domain-containing protein [Bacteroides sp.]
MYKKILLILFLTVNSVSGFSQHVAVKTNLLYGAYTLTPNLGLELALGKRSTLEFSGGYNPWNLDGSFDDNKKLVHWLGQVEYRYWLCRKFSGHFFGIHGLGTEYNISGHELPLLFEKGSGNYRYEGYGYGGGISYGYNFYLGRRWSLEANIGVGYARLHYDKYDCVKCGSKIGTESKNYLGPTKAGLSLIYYLK